MQNTLLCCGGLRTDYVITLENEARIKEMGGNAIYAAAGARLWLDKVAIVGRIGDNFPHAWLDELHTRGFDIRGIRNVGGQQDHRTFYAYIDANTRTDINPAAHFARIGVALPAELRDYVHSTPGQDNPDAYEPLALTPDDLAPLFTDDTALPGGLHIAPSSIRTQRLLPAAARQHGIGLVSVDPGERCMQPHLLPHIEAMLAVCDVFMPSDQEVRSLLGDQAFARDASACARWFAERGPQLVVLKLGSKGALIYEKSGAVRRVPALPVHVVDVTGAGDTFCGGFMAVYSDTGNAFEAALHGTVAASFTIEGYGAGSILNASRQVAQHRLSLLRTMTKD